MWGSEYSLPYQDSNFEFSIIQSEIVSIRTVHAKMRMLRVRIPIKSLIVFSNLPNPCNLAVALVLTRLQTKMSTRNVPGGEGRPVSLPTVSRLFRKCGILNVSKPYGPLLPVAGTLDLESIFICKWIRVKERLLHFTNVVTRMKWKMW
jgi:hypothetical protein